MQAKETLNTTRTSNFSIPDRLKPKEIDPISMEIRADAFTYVILGIVGIIANALVIASIVKTFRLRHSGFYTCVLILACVDIMHLLNLPMNTVALNSLRPGIIMCKLYMFMFTFGLYAKKLLLIAVAGIHIHRVRLMTSAESTITRRNALIVGMVVCVFIFSISLPMGVFAKLYSFGPSHTYCIIIITRLSRTSTRYYLLSLFILAGVFLAGLVITAIVLGVYFCLRRQELKASDGDGKLSALLIIQLVTETLSTVMFEVLSIYVYGAFNIILFIPSLIRPMLYLVFCPLLRRTFKWFVTCGGQCGNDMDETPLVQTEQVGE